MTNYTKSGCDQSSLLRDMMETVHQGITIVDRNLDILVVNETAMKILDIPYAVIKDGTNLEKLFRFNAERGDYGPGDPDQQVQARIEIARKFEPHDFVRTRPDGKVIRIQGTPNESGGFITIYSDVTEQRQQEQELEHAREVLSERLDYRTRELQENRDLLFNAVNAIQDGLGIANADGQVILANEKMKEIYPEFAACIVNNKTVSEVIRTIFPDEPDRDIDAIMDSNHMWQEMQFPDGKWYRIDRTRSTDGGIISVYSDITEYKKQQAALQNYTDELVRLLEQEKKLTEMQREFVSMASHEFRTPLAIIDSNAQRLKRRANDLKPQKVLDRVDRIRDSVSRMQYLISRFLSFSQTQSVGMEVDIQTQPFRHFVQSVCDVFSDASPTHKLDVNVDGLPDEYEYDQKLIELCIVNLLSNAVKYSPGSTQVLVEGSSSAETIKISVKDYGVGIPDSEIPKIFDRYFRASTSSGIAGTGIGLNMVAQIVENHNGRIDVTSSVGKGSRISINLPQRSAAAELSDLPAA